MAEKIDLLSDDLFCKMLMTRRAALLSDVDGIEEFFKMERTKDLRKEIKHLRYENEKLRMAIEKE